MVENHGRVNYIEYGSNRLNEERKGICGSVKLDEKEIKQWRIFPLDFKSKFLDGLRRCSNIKSPVKFVRGPLVAKTTLHIDSSPCDTFLDMKGWNKGIVIVNNFNLGRYWKVGPTRTLYIPAPLLKQGQNEILIFEQHRSCSTVSFLHAPLLGEKVVKKSTLHATPQSLNKNPTPHGP